MNIKTCPCCGAVPYYAKHVANEQNGYREHHVIRCRCGLTLDTNTREETLSRWNARHTTFTFGNAQFLREAARYFSGRPTAGDDRAYWANVYNIQNCLEIAEKIDKFLPEPRKETPTPEG